MSREIKFKAWDECAKKMLFAEEFPIYHEVDNGLHCGKLDENGDWCNLPLMQFTGLTDMNGVDIYEGDILKNLSNKDSGYKGDTVFFVDGQFRLGKNDIWGLSCERRLLADYISTHLKTFIFS